MYTTIMMPNTVRHTLALFPSLRIIGLVICLFFTFIQKGSALDCIQCMSLDETDCLSGDVKATPCTGTPDSDARFCHKAVGHEVGGHGHFVFRTCSRYAQNNCTHEKQKSGKVYKVCHSSCSTDGCNAAAQSTPPSGAMSLLLVCISGLFTALFV